VVLKFFFLCNLLLNLPFHLFFLGLPLPFLLLDVLNTLLEGAIVLIDLPELFDGLAYDWVVRGVVVVTFVGEGLDLLEDANCCGELLVLWRRLAHLAVDDLVAELVHGVVCDLFQPGA
jgi:hypothetical protein